jgi:2-phospho-L-lactate guanylyltransferase (CobY/MobA/RfbA family)
MIWAIIPIEPLGVGKRRLAVNLSPREQTVLSQLLLVNTLRVLNQVPNITRCLVVSRNPAALKFARQFGATTFRGCCKPNVNTTLRNSARIACDRWADGVLILRPDLPLLKAKDVELMLSGAIVDDSRSSISSPIQPRTLNENGYRRMGAIGRRFSARETTTTPSVMNICGNTYRCHTNALFVRPPTGFDFCYGEGSFKHNLQEARRLRVPHRVVHAPSITIDLDTERDWQTYRDLLQPGQQDALPRMPKNEERRSADASLLVHEAL